MSEKVLRFSAFKPKRFMIIVQEAMEASTTRIAIAAISFGRGLI